MKLPVIHISTSKSLPSSTCTLLDCLAHDMNVPAFALYGGAALDLLLAPESTPHDFDIAIPASQSVSDVEASLRRVGYRLFSQKRRFFINLTEEVQILLAEKEHKVLDITFLADMAQIGLYDLESLQYSYPQCKINDHFGALTAYEARTARPIRELDHENPYRFLSRLITLAAKYNLELVDNPVHKNYIDQINTRLINWHYGTDYHDVEAQAALYSSLLRSILRTNDRVSFAKNLAMAHIFDVAAPELSKISWDRNPRMVNALSIPTNKQELVNVLLELVVAEERTAILMQLSLMESRWWDKTDLDIARWAQRQTIENLDDRHYHD